MHQYTSAPSDDVVDALTQKSHIHRCLKFHCYSIHMGQSPLCVTTEDRSFESAMLQTASLFSICSQVDFPKSSQFVRCTLAAAGGGSSSSGNHGGESGDGEHFSSRTRLQGCTGATCCLTETEPKCGLCK